MNYENSKTSIFVENQFPSFIKKDGGDTFIDLIKTYYQWLEKNIVKITLKSEYFIEEDDIQIGDILESSFYALMDEELPEDDFILVEESTDINVIYDNQYSIQFDGENDYMDVSHPIFNIDSDWTISLWLKLKELPSLSRKNFDILTLDNNNYLSLMNINSESNTLRTIINDTIIDTNVIIDSEKWYYITIKYDSSENTIVHYIRNDSSKNIKTNTIDLSSITTNRFTLGCDLHTPTTPNYFKGLIDEVVTWNKFLEEEEINSLYNNGTVIDPMVNSGNYESSSNIENYFRFDDINDSIVKNEINTSNNGTLYNSPNYIFDVPFNISAIISESKENYSLSLNVLSYIRYDGGEQGVMSDRMVIFAEHIYGKLKKDIVVKYTNNGSILISDFVEANNPLNAINNIQNYQNIDYVFDYDNFVSTDYFQYLWKEIMYGFPLFLYPTHDINIKAIIGKNIKELYRSKGTYLSIKILFKLIYNEDLIIGEDIYSDGPYSYVIKTENFGSIAVEEFLKKICHPIGYNFELQSK